MFRVLASSVSLFIVPCVTAGETINVPGETGLSIQDGIDQAQAGDIVLIAAGTYNQVMDLDGKAITVQGVINSDLTHATWIQGFTSKAENPPEDTNPLVTCNTNETSATVIKDLAFEQSVQVGGSGAIQLTNASPTIENCLFQDLGTYAAEDGEAFLTSQGGAIYISGGSPTITRSIFRNC